MNFDNEICYTSGIYDKSTGQYYLNARYYDPEDGTFLTQDTYRGENTDPSSLHLYAYCAGDPINFIDPSGHKKHKISVGLSYGKKARASFSVTTYTKKDSQGKYRIKVKKPKIETSRVKGYRVTKSYTAWENKNYRTIYVMNHNYFWYDKIYVVKAITIWKGTTVKAFMNFALQLYGKPRSFRGHKTYFSNSSWVEKG